jgi:hypothetical protein
MQRDNIDEILNFCKQEIEKEEPFTLIGIFGTAVKQPPYQTKGYRLVCVVDFKGPITNETIEALAKINCLFEKKYFMTPTIAMETGFVKQTYGEEALDAAINKYTEYSTNNTFSNSK